MDDTFEVATGAIGELFWNITEAVLVCRPGRIITWNPGAEVMLGLPAPDGAADALDVEAVFGDATAALWDLIAAGSGKACLECRGGTGRILDANAWRLGGADGAPAVVVLRDVTDEHRHMEGLQRLNRLARELLAEPALDVLLVRIVDAARDLSGADFSALLLLRAGSEHEVARFVYNAPRELFPDRLPRAVGLLGVPISTRAVVRVDDIRGHPDGVGIPVEHPPVAALLAAPILVGDRPVGELAVANTVGRPGFDDVDEAVMTELAAHAALAVSLATARQAHEELDATRRALLDVALHNIRTPLTVAKGFLATLRTHGDTMGPEARARAFEAIDRAYERIEALAEGALLEDPFAAGPAPRDAARIDLAELAAELREAVGPGGGASLEVVFEPGAPTAFQGDPRLVRELLDSLVGNALKHSPPAQVVTVTVRREGDSVRFDVTDRGPGIPPEEQGRVWEQFFRTRQSIAQGLPGAGLGLWIARRLAELQGGAVGLSSRTGQGTTFWATFPVEPDRVEPPTGSATAPPRGSGAG